MLNYFLASIVPLLDQIRASPLEVGLSRRWENYTFVFHLSIPFQVSLLSHPFLLPFPSPLEVGPLARCGVTVSDDGFDQRSSSILGQVSS